MKVSLILLTYKRPQILRDALACLAASTKLHEIIVVDNDPDSVDLDFSNSNVPFRHLRTGENLGAVGRNRGIEIADSDLLITIDDDVSGIDDNAISAIRRRFEAEERLGALCFKVLDVDGHVINWCHHRPPESWADREFPTYEISEGAVAFRASALRESGLYPDSFFISHEGLDLACRLMAKGYAIRYDPVVAVKHLRAEAARESWRRYYYDTRNLVWIAIRNFSFRRAAPYLFLGLGSSFAYSLRDGFLRYWFRGLIDSMKGLRREWGQRHVISPLVDAQMRELDRYRSGILRMVRERLLRKRMEI